MCVCVYDLYSPKIVRVIKSRKMKWVWHVPCVGEERGMYRVLVGKPEGRNHWGDLGVDGWTVLGWPRIETGGGRLWVR